MTMHVEIETLSAYLDRDGRPVDLERVERHLESCDWCRQRLSSLRDLVAEAGALPREIEPPPEVWGSLRAHVASGRGGGRAARRAWWWFDGRIAAAAVLLLAVGVAVMASGILGTSAKTAKIRAADPTRVVTPQAILVVERNYTGTLGELRETLEERRNELSPGTIRIVERSVAVIDAAIAEARAALAADPGNAALVDILSTHYEHKVDLLRRAATISSTS